MTLVRHRHDEPPAPRDETLTETRLRLATLERRPSTSRTGFVTPVPANRERRPVPADPHRQRGKPPHRPAIHSSSSSMPADQPAGPTLAHATTAGPSDVLTPDDGHAVAALLSRPRSSDLRLEY
jgi:hypothetical protein